MTNAHLQFAISHAEYLAKQLRTSGPLTRPLKFGDPEQIAALRQWRQAIDDEAQALEDADIEVEWEITYTVEKTRIVTAVTADDAEETLRLEELDSVVDVLSVDRIYWKNRPDKHVPLTTNDVQGKT